MAGKKIGLILALDGEKEFIQAVQAAKKESKLFETQLKGLAEQYDGNANSLEHLQKKQELLTQQQAAYKRQLEASKSGLEKANSNYREQGKRLEELKKQLEEARNAQKQMEVAGETGSKAYDEQSKSVEKLEKAVENQTAARIKEAGSISDWNKKIYESERALDKSNKAIEDNEKYLKEAEVATDHCATSIDNMGKEVKQTEQSLEQFGDTADDVAQVTTTLGDKVVSAFVDKGASVAVDTFAKGVEEVKEAMYDVSSASTKLQASTGASTTAMTKYNAVMKEVKGNNFGESYSDVAEAMGVVIQTMGELNDTDLQNITESAMTLQGTFGYDYQEQLRTVDMLMKQFGITSTEAFNLIVQGTQQGLNKNGDLLDTINEYSVHYAQMGVSAEGFFNSLANGTDAGTFSVDKLGDAYKEFGIRVKDTATTTDEAYELLGLNADQMRAAFAEGGESASKATDMVLDALMNMDDKVKQNQAGVDLFGTMWEDLGITGVQALTDLEGEISSTKSAMESLKEVRYSDLESAVSGLGAALQENIVTPIADKALPVVTGLFEKATEVVEGIGDAIAPQKTELEQFVDDIKTSNDEIQTMLDSASQALDGADVDVSKFEAYKQTITELNDLENASGLQKYELQQAVNALSSDIPELAAAWDNETERINLSKGAIEDLIDQQIAYTKETAASLAMQETYNAKIAAEANKLKIDSSVKDLEERIEATRELNEATEDFKNGGYGDHYAELLDLEVALEDLTKEQEEANKTAEEAGKQYDNLQSYVEEATKAEEEASKKVAEHTDELEGLGDSANDTADSLGALGDAAGESTAKIEASAEAAKTAAQSMVETYHGYVDEIKADLQDKISLFDKFETSDGGEDQTVEKMTANLDSQIEAYQEYAENLAAVKDHVGKEIAPEFMQHLESMGMDGANTLKHILATFEEGDSGADKVKEMSDKWVQAMDMTESMAEVGAANKLAYEVAMGELGSSDADFSDLGAAIEKAAQDAGDGWNGLTQSTKITLEDAVQTAKEMGIQIPEGLTEGIASGEISATDAIAQMNGAIQGSFDGLTEIAKELGISIPADLSEGIEAGGQDAVDAYNALIAQISSATSTSEMNQKGQEEGSEYASGLESTADAAGTAAGTVAQSAADSMEQKQTEFQTAGKNSADQYVNALKSAIGQAAQASAEMARAARNSLNAYQSSFSSAGYNISAGVASGIRNGQSLAVDASIQMMRAALNAAKTEGDIHSPSRKFRDQVGAMISTGTAFGISDKASLAGKAATKMSNKVYTNAVSWLSKYKKSQQVSLADEKWYWQQVLEHTKAGTSAYNKALKKIQSINISELTSSGVSSAAAKKITSNFGVSKTTGSGKNKKTKDAETYYSEVYSAAEKYLSNQQVLNDWSLQQELAYWNAVKGQLKTGSQAWYDATKQINSLQADIAEAEAQAAEEKVKTHASVQKSILDSYKVYYKVSAKAEADYWNIARQQFAVGTDERIEADQNYLEALQEFYDQRKELDEDYAESSQDINDQLADSVKELQDTYKDAVESRKQDILSSMNLFESWDASGYDSNTLLYNLKTQVAGLTLWEQQLEELGRKGLSDALMEELSAMGPDAAANIYSMNQMTAEQLDEYNKLWEQKNALAHSQALKDNEDLLKETNTEITNLRTEAQSELNALNADYRAALQELNTGISSELKNLVSKSGSIGEDAVSSLIAGIGKAATSVDTYNSTTKVVDSISSQFATLKQEGQTIGKETLDSMLAELTDGAKITAAAQNAAQSIKQAMQQELAAQQSAMMELNSIGNGGIAMLNNMTREYGTAQTIVNVDNNGVMAAMNQVSAGLQTLIELIANSQLIMYPDVVAGELQPYMDKENASVAIQRNRGRY